MNDEELQHKIAVEISGSPFPSARSLKKAAAILQLTKQDREAQKSDRINYLKYRITQLKRKPTHGNCCTCQDCGQPHDECTCDKIRYIEREIEKLATNSEVKQ